MARIIECVPNFSEGQQKEIIEAIANAIASTEGCSLLDVDPGMSTNRTVYTFVGTPETVVEGALNAAKVASQCIDMRRHSGEHPRLGALDVCPFIPVQNVSMDDCVDCAKRFGERLGDELCVPVYLYGYAATEEYRKTLPQIRSGEYESLPEKLLKPEWKPDYGPVQFVPQWGATVTGARKFLIAYNVNLLSTKEQAHRIALNIREQGRAKDQPGRLSHVQAIGWYLEESNMAQVSINLTDHEITGLHNAYEEVCKDSKELNLAVVGSQIVGLVPLQAVLNTAEYYIKREKLFLLEEDQKVTLVIERLGLNSLGTFKPKERIIEYMVLDERECPLASMDLKDFVMTVGSRSPSPGGGSASALVAALGAALGSMVGFLTYGNRKFEHLDERMRNLIPPFYKTMKDLIPMVDADAMAFSDYMMAMKLPKNTEEEKQLREEAMQVGLKNAIQVPMAVVKTVNSLWPHMIELAKIGNISCKSDLQVGARTLETAAWGTYYNIMTNLKDFKSTEIRDKIKADAEKELKFAQEGCVDVLKILEERQEYVV